MKLKLIVFVGLITLVSSFCYNSINGFNVPQNWPQPVYNFKLNPLSENKIQLGRALFYDPILSRNNTISCASCHSQYSAFTHIDHALSHGIDDKIGLRNSPALMNLAWQKTFMWDGAVNHLDVQALAPISNPLEMDENIVNVVAKLQATKLYSHLFYEAFGDSLITGEHLLKSLSQFMLTLVSCNSKYDSVVRKLTSFTNQEKSGYQLFQKNCSSCHPEPLFTNNEFKNNGLTKNPGLNDLGRFAVTKNPTDSFLFKVPTLRNIEFSFPYMHDGRFNILSEVINHYTTDLTKTNKLSAGLRYPVQLTANEKVDLIAFLLTLSDKKFLFDPRHSYPKKIFMPAPKD